MEQGLSRNTRKLQIAMDWMSCSILGRIKCEWNLVVTSPGSGLSPVPGQLRVLGCTVGRFLLLHEGEIIIKRFKLSSSLEAVEFSGFRIPFNFPSNSRNQDQAGSPHGNGGVSVQQDRPRDTGRVWREGGRGG